MFGYKIKIEKKEKSWRRFPKVTIGTTLGLLLVSLLVHFFSVVRLDKLARNKLSENRPLKNPIRVKLGEQKKKKNPESKEPEAPSAKRIVEVPQTETKPPQKSNYLGMQNHQTEKETKPEKQIPLTKGADPGPKGLAGPPKPLAKQPTTPQNAPPQESHSKASPQKSFLDLKAKVGSLNFSSPKERKPRNLYESLLPPSQDRQIMAEQPGGGGGFQDIIDEDLAKSERIDLNTSSFKYISYFSSVRKSIELVWIYPREAVMRRLYGEVLLEIVIEKDGRVSRVKVVKSSGHSILDQSMVETIKLAQPFGPLPKGWNKERVVVVGAFRYILTAFAGY